MRSKKSKKKIIFMILYTICFIFPEVFAQQRQQQQEQQQQQQQQLLPFTPRYEKKMQWPPAKKYICILYLQMIIFTKKVLLLFHLITIITAVTPNR